MMQAIRDWWRGYSQADVESVLQKVEIFGGRASSVVYMTKAEKRALQTVNIAEHLLSREHHG